MKQTLHRNNHGIAHIALVIVLVVVLAGIGFAAYRVMNQDTDYATSPNNTPASENRTAEVTCELDDENLCKFFKNFSERDSYKMTLTKVGESGKTTATISVQGDRTHMVFETSGQSSEIITIGRVHYTKAGDIWYKKTIEEGDTVNDYSDDYRFEFGQSNDKPGVEYKKIGKEACGDLTCFKYQVVDTKFASDSKQFIYFDDKDYQLRMVRTEDGAGISEILFVYQDATVNEPSPVKELGPDQYMVPGQAEPETVPSGL